MDTQKPDIQKRYYRVDEAAAYFNVSSRTIYRLLEEEELQATRIRGCLRISVTEIQRYEQELLLNDPMED